MDRCSPSELAVVFSALAPDSVRAYAALLEDHGIDGSQFALDGGDSSEKITEANLKDLGVSLLGDRLRILSFFSELHTLRVQCSHYVTRAELEAIQNAQKPRESSALQESISPVVPFHVA